MHIFETKGYSYSNFIFYVYKVIRLVVSFGDLPLYLLKDLFHIA
jgi:hypothetical protein